MPLIINIPLLSLPNIGIWNLREMEEVSSFGTPSVS